ncbi:putative multiple sugar transport system substrate-binding protein [Murinocardiopsis flavida]|uniref:Putative multiple sugar transport system substrate-binding protein n=1 Tax=Murinocardiopsis flavida TaxID=645275 RepID=A0A2P8D2A5_9ACTN|nr:multiple monosaccharide ABC transporter substrate-binding protein [Murinocardiopsis flavida]PSK91360.1 putative multiple sugar transport system substrate-binding protein [Murinocardiopsis flavida]
MRNRHLLAAGAAALTLLVSSCAVGDAARETGENGTIGIAMPTKSSERWVDDGANMVAQFEKAGYGADLQYAEDVVENQVSQIENMITKGVDALVIAAIDGEALTDVLQTAADSDIPVISYDRLIRGTEHVDYYATFDNHEVGVLQGAYIEKALNLEKEKGPFSIELFGGSPDDNNAYFFYDGAMSVLKPYIDDGVLDVRSGQTSMKKIATLRWDGATAQSRMDNLLSAHYSDTEVDAVLSPYDGISIGVISSLKGVGYGEGDKPLPVITGQDAEAASVKSIVAGEQTQTVFKDTRKLAEVAVQMTDAVVKGDKPEVNDTESYENGKKTVPSYLLEPVSVDADNYREELLDSGYYKESELE